MACRAIAVLSVDAATGAAADSGVDDMAVVREYADHSRRVPARPAGLSQNRQAAMPIQANTTALPLAYHEAMRAATLASMRLRLIFMVGVRQPFSIDQGSAAITSICRRS